MSESRLYFVALVPDASLLGQVRKIKEEMAQRFQSRAALRSPAHITLHMPFQWREDREDRLKETMLEIAADTSPFTLQLVNFEAFKPRVIYIDLKPSEDLIELHKRTERQMRRQLHLFGASWKNQAFHPHMTVAFRDLRPAQFDLAWKEFKDRSFDAFFQVSNICLLKHHHNRWEVHECFTFSK
jgi:2'-5' RNA ligase